ncbi:sigma-54-dependent transcriptional regulator [Sediminicola luteus]|uniref:Sigma-54-dependent Fis family transcriptional regulator n=1 Tax=Sediminicola luteus TaxID=319238 RepID=A0A2A4G5W8_9FLAO|nr:sigma-54 dependent transcriptional regulator [Sediminicola luteus]PCE63132.1 sigma-54-dependent Fis family transcriptional regulator [Sediminicola luteus]
MRKTEATLLLVDDDPDILFTLKVFLKRFYSQVITLNDPKKILETLSASVVDVVLMDMNFKRGVQTGAEGLYWQKRIAEVSPETVIILMTAYSDVSVAVEGIKQGAFDYVLKPWDNDKLQTTLSAAVAHARSKKAGHKLEKISSSDFQAGTDVIGQSETFTQTLQLVSKVADTHAHVLLLGENGTGKYVIAKMLHDNSSRKQKPFIHVDLGSLNENLFESELFGYAKGAFTDAKEDSLGRFELADGGTIFLDEIGNLPLQLQTKLLSVLQTQSVVRLGEGRERKVDVRIICATNLDLHKEVGAGNFRQDLLYRINTVEIELPALRHRKTDIPLLAEYYLERNRKKYRKGRLQFANDALKAMENYAWPGNIRELEHLVERAVILCDGSEIQESDMRFSKVVAQVDNAENLNLEQMEKQLVAKALRKHLDNISNAAKELGLTRAALYRRMEKHGL